MARRVCDAPVPLMIEGRSSPKVRKAREGDVTDEQIDIFLTTLGETCNVQRSARAAKMSASHAYRRRRQDAAFRAGWAQAVREGYAKLELMLLERAMKGTPKAVSTRGGDRIIREYSTSLAVALLKRHADTAESAAYEPDPAETEELRARILEKLARLRESDAGEPAAIETKSAAGRAECIRRALKG